MLFSESWLSQRHEPERHERVVASIDQGTTSTRVLIVDARATVLASAQMEHEQIYPRDGWCEHSPNEILRNTKECLDRACVELESRGRAEGVRFEVASVGITNQRETTVVWDARTGKPLHNAIVWLDMRTSELVEEVAAADPALGKDRFRAVTGLPVSTYFSALKLMWLKRHEPKVAFAIGEGRALFGTIDTWLIWNLSGGAGGEGTRHVTDVTNASRTMLMDLATGTWHAPTCAALGIPVAMLPRITSCAEVVATMAGTRLDGVPIAGVLGDQHAAMLGQSCLAPGEAKSTYGTGAFVLMNVGPQPVASAHGLLSTVCFQLGPDAPRMYALEGSVAIAGRAVQWLRDSLGLIGTAAEVEALARSVDSTEGVTFVPAFSGLFAPHWRPDARGCITGLTLYTGKAHVCRACLEGVAMQAREVLDAFAADAQAAGATTLRALKVDGGMAVNTLLMQMQADVLRVPIELPRNVETTALGAAFAAGLAVGVWPDVEALRTLNPAQATYTARIGEAECEAKLARWKDAVQRTLGLALTA